MQNLLSLLAYPITISKDSFLTKNIEKLLFELSHYNSLYPKKLINIKINRFKMSNDCSKYFLFKKQYKRPAKLNYRPFIQFD